MQAWGTHCMRSLFVKLRTNLVRSGRETRRWFAGGTAFWAWCAITLAILIGFYFLPGTLSDRVRWAGTAFELMGVAVIVWGINRTRRSFGRETVLQGFWQWLCEFRFIFVRRPPISLSAHFRAGAEMSARLNVPSVWAARNPEERFEHLERAVDELRGKIDKVDTKVENKEKELRNALEKEANQREAEDKELVRRLEASMIGDNHVELAGVAYLLIGLVMANVSSEVATGLQWFGLR